MSGGTPLCAEERETISRELGRETSARGIAKLLGRHHSTIAREIDRNGGAGHYRAIAAQERYESFKVRPKEHKLVASSRLHDAVNEGLEQKWSPEQISSRLTEEYPDDPEMRVSHETLYQTLYLQAKGELRTELKLALRQGRAKRVPRSRASVSRGKIPDMVNISERPAEAEDPRGTRFPGRGSDHRERRKIADRDPGRANHSLYYACADSLRSLRRARRRALGQENGNPSRVPA